MPPSQQTDSTHSLESLSLSPQPTSTLRFTVSAPTKYGDTILLSGSSPTLGSFHSSRAIFLTFESPNLWTCQLTHPLPSHSFPTYKYGLLTSSGTIIWESGRERHLCDIPAAPVGMILIRDEWRSSPSHIRNIFGTAAFTRVVFRRPVEFRTGRIRADAAAAAQFTKALVVGRGAYVIRFEVFAERVRLGDEVCVTGELDELGSGDINNAVAMVDCDSPVWTVCVAMRPEITEVRYRFVIREKKGGTLVGGDKQSRVFVLNEGDKEFLQRKVGEVVMVCVGGDDTLLLERRWKGAGVALPVFSVRSERSCGVGEFDDLKEVVDFCVRGGFQLLQLLPVNDTTAGNGYRDSYPYSAVSSFALHPLYMRIESLGDMAGKMGEEFERARTKLNQLEKIDYVKVMHVKMKFIRRFYVMHKDEFLQSKEFMNWFEENQNWLVPYALFRFFMELNGSSNYDHWGARQYVSVEDMRELAAPDTFHFDHLGAVYYTQFHLHKQLAAAAEYAAENGVVFKGDLPIGVNRYCTDTWVNPHLFRLHVQAGAPPDYFSEHGQNWYFPTYNWEAMSKDNYGWWRSRLGHMANYFHAYRIDHILGFFRIWEVPESFKTGMSGRFYPAHGISRQELESLGLWDIDRYCMPFVHDGILQQMFSDDWWKIKDRFFEPVHGRLKFKEKYDTERKIEKALTLPADAPEAEKKFNAKVTRHLFTLINNVCLLHDDRDSDIFHPRFLLHQTNSYAELPSNEWKGRLYNLHEDYMHRRQDELWKKNGMERLPMVKSASDMLVCGEDLGLIPKCVPHVMEEMSILSLAVQRMPAGDVEFGRTSEYKYECVATTSSHDTSTFRGWWEQMSAVERMRYWTDIMGRDKHDSPPEKCTADVAQWVVEDHLASPAMWTIFPIQDLLAIDEELKRPDAAAEQINDPSNPEHIWCFRLHVDIEKILEKKMFIDKLATLNRKHKRGVPY